MACWIIQSIIQSGQLQTVRHTRGAAGNTTQPLHVCLAGGRCNKRAPLLLLLLLSVSVSVSSPHATTHTHTSSKNSTCLVSDSVRSGLYHPVTTVPQYCGRTTPATMFLDVLLPSSWGHLSSAWLGCVQAASLARLSTAGTPACRPEHQGLIPLPSGTGQQKMPAPTISAAPTLVVAADAAGHAMEEEACTSRPYQKFKRDRSNFRTAEQSLL